MKKKKTILSLLFLAVLMGATYFVLEKCGRELNFSQMAQFISNGNKLYLALALLNMVLFILLEAVSLRSIYRHLGQDTGFWPSIIYSTSDIYFSAITPSAAGGQPASAFYMVRDGMPVSVATSALLLNIVCYTASLDIIGVFTLLTNVEMFLGFDLSVQLLILLGIGIQFVLLIFFVLCMYKSHVVYKVCSGGLGLLARLNIVHNREVLEQKLRKTIGPVRTVHRCDRTAKMAACQSAAAQPIPAGCPDSDYLLCLYECSDGPLLPQCDGKAGVLHDWLQFRPAARGGGSV